MNNRPGDWNCRLCFHLNFQRRDSCQRCGDPKPQLDHYSAATSFGALRASSGAATAGSNSPLFGFSIGPDVRPGDWYCTVANCGAHNFASRSTCFKCGAFKLDHAADSSAAAAATFDHADMSSRGRSAFGAAAFSSPGNNTRSSTNWKSGDWICTRSGCNEHNFASRMECFRCNAPRVLDSTTMTSSSYF